MYACAREILLASAISLTPQKIEKKNLQHTHTYHIHHFFVKQLCLFGRPAVAVGNGREGVSICVVEGKDRRDIHKFSNTPVMIQQWRD